MRSRKLAPRLSFEDRRETIIVAACQVIGERGVDALRVSDVADAAGISQPLVSKHFPDRNDLLAAAFEYGDRVGVEALTERDAHKNASGAERVHDWLSSFVDDSDPALILSRKLWNQVWSCRSLGPDLTLQLQRSQRYWLAQVASFVRDAQADGSASTAIDPEHAALHLVTLTDGLPPALAQGTLSRADAEQLLRRAVGDVLGAGEKRD